MAQVTTEVVDVLSLPQTEVYSDTDTLILQKSGGATQRGSAKQLKTYINSDFLTSIEKKQENLDAEYETQKQGISDYATEKKQELNAYKETQKQSMDGYVTGVEEFANDKKQEIEEVLGNIEDNEQQRITAEQERESAETNRESQWNTLKQEAQDEVDKISAINVTATKESNSFSVSITDKDGNVTDSGNLMGDISIGVINTVGSDEQANASITGVYGEQKLNLDIPVGKPYRLVKSYPSIADMIVDYDSSTDVALYEFVIIDTGDVEDEDNAKMYMKGEIGWVFIADLSGSAGVQGLTGKTPSLSVGSVVTGVEGSSATVTITGTTDNPVLNFTIPRGATGTVGNLSALTLPYNSTDDTETTKEVIEGIKTEVADKLDESSLSQVLTDGDYSRILSYADLAGTVTGKFIFKDTQANANLALSEGKLPDGTIVIITDD